MKSKYNKSFLRPGGGILVDARDLKSLGTLYRASSSLAPGTRE